MATRPRPQKISTTVTARDVMVVKCVCERCKTPYSYEKQVTAGVSVMSHTPGEVSRDAEALKLGAALSLANRRKEIVDKSEVGSQPCPKCGYYQSYMAEDAADTQARMLSWLPTLVLILVAGQRGCAAIACAAPLASDGTSGDTRGMQAVLLFAAALVVKYAVELIYRPWWLEGWKQARARTTFKPLKPEISWKSEQRS